MPRNGLIDVNDVALGHTTKLRWSHRENWIWSERPAHPALIDDEHFGEVLTLLAVPGGAQEGRATVFEWSTPSSPTITAWQRWKPPARRTVAP